MKAAIIAKNKSFIIWLVCVSIVATALIYVYDRDVAELKIEQQTTGNNLNAIDAKNVNCLQNMYQLP